MRWSCEMVLCDGLVRWSREMVLCLDGLVLTFFPIFEISSSSGIPSSPLSFVILVESGILSLQIEFRYTCVHLLSLVWNLILANEIVYIYANFTLVGHILS